MRTLYKFLIAGVVSALFVQVGFAQKENVGIGTTKPDQSAILDLSSTNKGLLMPRVTLQQRSNIQNPANGLIVYQTDMISGFYFFDGKEWKSVGAETAQNSVTDAFNWGLTGNSGTTASNFLGTTDAIPLKFKSGNQISGYLGIYPNTNTFFGYLAGSTNTLPTSTGDGNIAIGSFAMEKNTSGGGNFAIGTFALRENTSGGSNFALGINSLYNNTVGQYNLGIGPNSLLTNTTGSSNTSIGQNTLGSNTIGSDNIALGQNSLYRNVTGSKNISIGNSSGFSNTGSSNIFLGYNAGYSETGSNKLYVSNTNTATPLIYGDFTTKYLAVGEVAAADRAAATSGGYRLLVKGGMITEKIKVAVAGSSDWADYVFSPSYQLMTLEKVESFIKNNKHLPNVPSAEEMSNSGLDVLQTSAKLMEKIEELTLYLIELNKEVKYLKEENQKLKK